MHQPTTATTVPGRAWAVVFAGMGVNLSLGILYAWSVWKAKLLAKPDFPAGTPMEGINAGWVYLSDAQATWAYTIAGMVFAFCMIPGGKLQDRFGPRVGARLGGLLLAGGCVIAGLSKSYAGLLVGFGLLGGIGTGIGYASALPAAVRWFGTYRRGLVVGLVVGGYGGAAIYISPLAKYLIDALGISMSFICLGAYFAIATFAFGSLLTWPPADYVPPSAPQPATTAAKPAPSPASFAAANWATDEAVKTWQFYAIFFLLMAASQAGLLVITNAVPMLTKTADNIPFLHEHAWLLASFSGLMNCGGRIGTGFYSDRIGRLNAFFLNGVLSTICLLAMPWIMQSGNVWLLFLTGGVTIWQFGGGLSFAPAITADYFGAKNLGLNYGLIFIAWGLAFLFPQLAGYLKDHLGSLDYAFYMSAALLIAALVVNRLMRPPVHRESHTASA